MSECIIPNESMSVMNGRVPCPVSIVILQSRLCSDYFVDGVKVVTSVNKE